MRVVSSHCTHTRTHTHSLPPSLLRVPHPLLESLIQSSDYILCLDTLAALSHDTSHDPHQRPPSLAVHVSKPPKEGSAGALMLDILNQVSGVRNSHMEKKIKATNLVLV